MPEYILHRHKLTWRSWEDRSPVCAWQPHIIWRQEREMAQDTWPHQRVHAQGSHRKLPQHSLLVPPIPCPHLQGVQGELPTPSRLCSALSLLVSMLVQGSTKTRQLHMVPKGLQNLHKPRIWKSGFLPIHMYTSHCTTPQSRLQCYLWWYMY